MFFYIHYIDNALWSKQKFYESPTVPIRSHLLLKIYENVIDVLRHIRIFMLLLWKSPESTVYNNN